MMARLAFNLLLLAGAGYFVWSATGYEPQARQIPLLIGGLVLVLQAWVTAKEAAAALQGVPLPLSADAAETVTADTGRRVAAMCGWMALFFALFVVLGTLPATFLFIVLFLLTGGRSGWWPALLIAAAVAGTIWLLFVKLMRFELYPGLLFGGTLPPL